MTGYTTTTERRKKMISDERVCSFHVGQVWMTSKVWLYRVISVERRGQALLRLGFDGKGRKIKRGWDEVINWVLHSDT
jgi:hypothetical protein